MQDNHTLDRVENQAAHFTYQVLLKSLFKNNKFNLFMSILGALILSIAIIFSSWVVQQSIDYVMGDKSITFINLILSAIIVAILILIAGFCVYFFRTNFTVRAVQQYRELAVKIIIKKDIADFEKHNTSTYLSALTNDINMIKENYLDQIPIIIQILICSIGAVILMMYYNPILTIIALFISLIPTLASMRAGKTLETADLQVSNENSTYMEKLGDILNGFGVIKNSLSSESMSKNLENQNYALRNKLLKREKKLEKINYYAAMSGYISQFSVLLICVYFAVFKKSITAGTIVVFIRLMTYIIDPVTNLPEMFSKARASMGMIKKFSAILYTEEHPDICKKEKKTSFTNQLSINNVSYIYENSNEYALYNWNITFEKGKKYIIVGASGSGKSTLFHLLTNTYFPTKGDIFIDDVPTHHLEPNELYKIISIVYQQNFIFNDTILNNLTLYKNLSAQDIEEAIHRAALDEVIAKRGLDYLCGENGENLSGGECQRIAIARSYLCHTQILLFDEATSALDCHTAEKVMHNLLKYKNETVIAITHVLEHNILKDFDSIIAVNKGQIVETGNFEELIKKEGYFYSLYTTSTK